MLTKKRVQNESKVSIVVFFMRHGAARFDLLLSGVNKDLKTAKDGLDKSQVRIWSQSPNKMHDYSRFGFRLN